MRILYVLGLLHYDVRAKYADISLMTQAIVVITGLPEYETALKLAAELVEKRLAACVNILPPMTSVYEWKGKLEKGQEHLLLIKTTERCYLDLEAYIRRFHPYELPEIIALPVKPGLSPYLDWVRMQTVE
jgi:periplasmic divalent cation tolerance protein